jgi:acyl-coenzyme A synthetase/AMP-(fatty) acid ligase
MITASNKIAIIDGEKQFTYYALLQHITIFSDHLNVNPGDIVMVYSEPRFGYACALYAI